MSKKPKDPFISTLISAFKFHPNYKRVWDWLLGNKIPSPSQQRVLIAHFKSYGIEVSPRDFIRGTAASNNPIFIHLRLLRRSGDGSDVLSSFPKSSAQHEKGSRHAEKVQVKNG